MMHTQAGNESGLQQEEMMQILCVHNIQGLFKQFANLHISTVI